jgi:hypothetical protein
MKTFFLVSGNWYFQDDKRWDLLFWFNKAHQYGRLYRSGDYQLQLSVSTPTRAHAYSCTAAAQDF